MVATNHGTACAEQMLIAALQPRGVYFWARASVFPGGFWNWLFRQGHLIPIYRVQEGRKNMSKNKDTFDLSQQLLLRGKMLYIAPEGNCAQEKRLREFKTGTARIALQTAAAVDFKQPVYLLPAGVNYSHHTRFRSDVMISFGKPIDVGKYADLYKENPQQAYRSLTEALRAAIRQEMVYIERPEDDDLAESLLVLWRNEERHNTVFPAFTRDRSRLEMEQYLADKINQASEDERQELAARCRQYLGDLEKEDLDDKAVCGAYSNSVRNALLLVLLLPLAVLGHWGGWLPMTAARRLRNSQVRDKQFWAPVALVFAALTWAVYGLAVSVIGAFFMGWWALALVPALVGGQFLTLYYREAAQIWKAIARYKTWKQANLHRAHLLEKQRFDIMNYFNASYKVQDQEAMV